MRLVLKKGPTVYVRRKEFDITRMVDQFGLIEDTSLDATHVPPYVGFDEFKPSVAFYDEGDAA